MTKLPPTTYPVFVKAQGGSAMSYQLWCSENISDDKKWWEYWHFTREPNLFECAVYRFCFLKQEDAAHFKLTFGEWIEPNPTYYTIEVVDEHASAGHKWCYVNFERGLDLFDWRRSKQQTHIEFCFKYEEHYLKFKQEFIDALSA